MTFGNYILIVLLLLVLTLMISTFFQFLLKGRTGFTFLLFGITALLVLESYSICLGVPDGIFLGTLKLKEIVTAFFIGIFIAHCPVFEDGTIIGIGPVILFLEGVLGVCLFSILKILFFALEVY